MNCLLAGCGRGIWREEDEIFHPTALPGMVKGLLRSVQGIRLHTSACKRMCVSVCLGDYEIFSAKTLLRERCENLVRHGSKIRNIDGSSGRERIRLQSEIRAVLRANGPDQLPRCHSAPHAKAGEKIRMENARSVRRVASGADMYLRTEVLG